MIEPDTKSWTWVLDRPCPDCGYDARTISTADVAPGVRANTAVWRTVVHDRQRPDERTWSPLEYACHVRDVHRVFHERLHLMLTTDDPRFANWDQDETAVAQRYGEQDPAQVANEVQQAAYAVAGLFDGLDDQQWKRPGRRSDGASFTVASLARYYLHDLVHHRHDVGA